MMQIKKAIFEGNSPHMYWSGKAYSFLCTILFSSVLGAQVYVVNTDDDVDNGACTVAHCSLREAINAAESDSVPSTIIFKITGFGKHYILPSRPFPTVTQNDLTIIGESQQGGAGTIVIDFDYEHFIGVGFWNILAKRFKISGIDFTHFLFDNEGDYIFQFGADPKVNSADCSIYNCSFIQDSAFNTLLSKKLISVSKAENLCICSNYFGTDHTLSNILNLAGYIYIAGSQNSPLNIDSNIFVNKTKMIEWLGGELNVKNNIFGALDTFKAKNIINPDIAIFANDPSMQGLISNNFFFGFQKSAIQISSTNFNPKIIVFNRFYNNNNDISISGYGWDVEEIQNNFAKNGSVFLKASKVSIIELINNNISNYDTVFYNLNNQSNSLIRHIDNSMTCIHKKAVLMDATLFPSHPIPIINLVNRNQIMGSGNPNDSLIVYANNQFTCLGTVCEAGVELGRTRVSNSGNWILNTQYPNKSTISAYQFDSNPNQRPSLYSEFSSCYQCPGIVHTNYSQSICPGETINYRGHTFSDLNPIDSFLIQGDVSICDSMFHINLFVYPASRSQMDLQICSNDTLRFGSVLIHQDHLLDSIILQSGTGCDSTVTINAVIVGRNKLSRSICENDTLKIGNTIFNKDHLSGPAIIKGGSSLGCDSIVDVNLSINNFFSVDLPNDTTVHKGSPITIKPFVNFIPISIKWSPNLYLDCDTCLYPISKPENNITYQLTAKDPNGCDVSDLITISILVDNAEIFIPNAFSPNGDNINDIFQPVFKFPNSTAIKEFRIYDRWGDQIYQRLDGAIGEIFGWDGTANGDKMNPGVYIYWIQFAGEDNVIKVKAGDVTLMR